MKDLDYLMSETIVSQKLSDLTTRRVIIIVMSVMMCIPVFTADTYGQTVDVREGELTNIYKYY